MNKQNRMSNSGRYPAPYDQFADLIDLLAESVAERVAAKLEVKAPRAPLPIERPVHVPVAPDGRSRMLRMSEVKARVGLSQTTIYARIKKGTFPKQVLMGTLAAWLESEIDEWIAACVADRPGAQQGRDIC
ncbi:MULTISPECIES: helix-turn-helix transcriptional regulator [Xanthomonas]|uniref:helix-turn-helix transcriptional regulator n=1 Tax=Xanthomonas TaxID=338 RepID=UPI001F3BEA9E|nr:MULTISPECIES: AlpA family transcriptional regulator [Xanthomonas]MDS0759154.1 AlpA family transcriptional regulator [Xanthomonas citri pv. punicae]MDS0762931.1 AlpA family transcriptional regulator [Xanthomonas citri pv. punicae]MDS0797700.1 AlpA family transcriptional regulator [Xanthomonas citri pv. punicae]MDS0830335.1 AlpA family transcriptional regulator [Xanthomonas citri pv. punicae]MDS0834132.1 AlpA family transcriptional regulator [Xanthomonas citri pv. punicae]